MLNLADYTTYWRSVAKRIPEITDMLPVTVDDEMAKRVAALRMGSVTLFVMPPAAQSVATTYDSYAETCECIVFVMERFDPQRRPAWEVLESSHPIMERIKELLLDDGAFHCPVMLPDPRTFNTLPESKFFAGFAGWSLGFKTQPR